jgi:leucyl aminopeptidase
LVVFLKNAREEALAEGTLLAEATLLARNLINEPANIMTPEALAEEAKNRGREAGFQVEILDKDDIEDLGMGAFLAVAGGSKKKPKLIVLRYLNDQENPQVINGIVGKGLMYDSGGLSIKPTNSMLEMKSDMSGAAAVIGAFTAIAEAGLKVNAVGVIAACENMISGKSYRPGDILTTMAGKTVFIGNTDAEGRLTLVDAIHYIIEKEKVSNIVDFATLTGAAVVALGDTTTAVLSNNDDLYNEIAQASSEADERIWRLPLFDDYKEKLKAKEADLTNSAGNPGTITAALFIEAFVQEKPWVHLDIAGTSWTEKEYDYYSAGGTGYGVRTIFHWLKNKSR